MISALPFATVAFWQLVWPFAPNADVWSLNIRVVALRLLNYKSPARTARALFPQKSDEAHAEAPIAKAAPYGDGLGHPVSTPLFVNLLPPPLPPPVSAPAQERERWRNGINGSPSAGNGIVLSPHVRMPTPLATETGPADPR